jgi:gamma-glutamylcysteine synthetase
MRSQVVDEPFNHSESPFVEGKLEEEALFDMSLPPIFDEERDVPIESADVELSNNVERNEIETPTSKS